VQARDVGVLETPTGIRLPYLVLEWVDGATLEQVLADETARAMPPRRIEEAVRLLNPIGVALGLAHAAGVVHPGRQGEQHPRHGRSTRQRGGEARRLRRREGHVGRARERR
jgi:hypothetical protein